MPDDPGGVSLFAQRLEARARELGVSAAELGRSAGVTGQQVGRYFSGKNEPTITVAARMAARLEVSLDELAGLARGHRFSPQTISQLRELAKRLDGQRELLERILGDAAAGDAAPDGMAADALRVAEGISGMPGAARVPTLQDADDALRDVDAAWEREARLQAGGSPRRRPVDRPRTDS